MIKLASYKEKYKCARLDRRGGVLEVVLHSDGGPFRFGAGPHEELGYLFADIGRDEENLVVIITGTGDSFCAEFDWASIGETTPESWTTVYKDGKHLIMNLLDIEVPVIAAVNGPALIHAEIAVLSDIVLAADNAEFQDAPHFPNGIVPGDGVHVIWPLLLGPNRGRYFLLTGQKLSAREALSLGVVSELMAPAKLMPRARELAAKIAAGPRLTSRYARVALTQNLKRLMLDDLGYGLAVEGLAALAAKPGRNG